MWISGVLWPLIAYALVEHGKWHGKALHALWASAFGIGLIVGGVCFAIDPLIQDRTALFAAQIGMFVYIAGLHAVRTWTLRTKLQKTT